MIYILRIISKNMSINIRRNTLTYFHINTSVNISICVYIGISTSITINMNRFLIFVAEH